MKLSTKRQKLAKGFHISQHALNAFGLAIIDELEPLTHKLTGWIDMKDKLRKMRQELT